MVSDCTKKKDVYALLKLSVDDIMENRGGEDVGEFKFFFFHVKILLEQRNSKKKRSLLLLL